MMVVVMEDLIAVVFSAFLSVFDRDVANSVRIIEIRNGDLTEKQRFFPFLGCARCAF